jgi:tetratricopeptide (TPR) repeat protein
MEGQGGIHFPITAKNPRTQEFFNQGVAQMHSFWAVEAERSFLQAAALDPEAPMPQWGIAMVAAGDFRPRFQLARDSNRKPEQPSTLQGGAARAAAAAQKALELSAAPGKATPLEKLYIAAIAARRNRDEKDPDRAYIQGLRAIVSAYPEEVEAKTYLALHLMQGFTTPDKQPREGSMEAVHILRELLAKAPGHPGVHHYVIHGFEGSTFARDAWPSCKRYPELSPNIPHALHMPGHIYAQTGKWQEAASAFEDAAKNELGYMRADKLYHRGHHGHNVHFLTSTYCFQGRYEDAVRAARSLLDLGENPREAAQVDNFRTAYRQGWFALLRTLVHFEKWDEILNGPILPELEKPREQAWKHWARGLAFSARNHVPEAKREAAAMDRRMKELAAKTKEDVPKPLQVAREELDGHIAAAQGKLDKAIRTLQAAARDERALRYNEPPAYPRPVLEALGRLAIKSGRLTVAEGAFRQALEQYPESQGALSGLNEILRRERKAVSAGE